MGRAYHSANTKTPPGLCVSTDLSKLLHTIAYSYAQILPNEQSCSVYNGYVTTSNFTHVPTANKKADKKLLLILGSQEYNLSTRENLSFGEADNYYNSHGFAR